MHFDQYFVQSNVSEMSRFVSSVCLSSLLMASESLLKMQVAVVVALNLKHQLLISGEIVFSKLS